MKLIKSLIALTLVIILGIFVYFFIYKGELAKKELAAHEKMLVRFDLDNITGFTLYRADDPIVFERGVGRLWHITSPIITDAEKEVLFNMFEALNTSEILFTIDEDPDDLSPYGLDNKDFYMAMDYLDDNPDTLFLGNPTPDGTMSYVRFASEQRVLSIDKSVSDRLKRDLRYYRSHTVLNALEDDITAVDIVRADDDQVTMVNTGYSWYMKKPWDLEGDVKNMRELIKFLSDLPIKAIIEEKTDDMAKYGLDDPRMMVTVSLKYGMPDRFLLIGDDVKIPNQLAMTYVKLFDRDAIMLVDNTLCTKLTRIPEWFIYKNPVKIFRERVDKIVLNTRGNTVTFSKDAERNWFVTEPIDKNVPIETINKIWGLSSNILLQGMHKYEPTEADMKTTGFENPSATISLYEQDTLLDGTVFGKSITSDEPITYYMTMNSPSIYISKAPINADINMILNTVFSE